jgi:DNA-binding beta-propeller fold protein YncE
VKYVGSVELPAHVGQGGFDHAAVHRGRNRLYVAHTASDAVDVIDVAAGRYVRSIEGLRGVAGALVDEEQDLVFTSNRGEDTVGIFSPQSEDAVAKVPVGVRPNGLAYDPGRGLLLSANVGDPRSPSVTLVDVVALRPIVTVPMPGRTRWAVFDLEQRVFFVNIADPFQIAVIDPEAPDRIRRFIELPARGPHGLELDRTGHRLLCACDEGKLLSVDSRSGEVLGTLNLSGPPDVVFLNPSLGHLYVAIGDPGVVDVVDVSSWRTVEVVPTERGAHTIAFDEDRNTVYAFLPQTHRAAVFEDGG